MVQLSNDTLDQLSVPGPGYDRSRVTAGIVHFGVGGFHRAHQAMYLDQLMARGEALDFGICGVGVMHPRGARSRRYRRLAQPQLGRDLLQSQAGPVQLDHPVRVQRRVRPPPPDEPG